MAEFIAREALMLKLKEYVTLCGYDYVIRNAPAADVAPVVHGRWIEHEFEDEPCYGMEYECSNCGRYQFDNTPYCPNCGARMDGDNRATD